MRSRLSGPLRSPPPPAPPPLGVSFGTENIRVRIFVQPRSGCSQRIVQVTDAVAGKPDGEAGCAEVAELRNGRQSLEHRIGMRFSLSGRAENADVQPLAKGILQTDAALFQTLKRRRIPR